MKWGRVFLLVLVVACAGVVLSFSKQMVRAETTIESLQKQIDELEALKKSSEEATGNLEKELSTLEQRIRNARAGIAQAKQQIAQREQDTAVQYILLSGRVAQQYKRSRTLSPLMLLFTSASASDLTKNLAYGSSVQAQDNRMIREFSEEIVQLEKDQKTLAALEAQLEAQATFFAGEIDKARNYQETLSTQIASLTSQQQAIIAARSGSYVTGVGAVPTTGDFDSTIAGFNQNAPGNSFAVFSFGAHTHRNGMSQYGAKARAEGGQDYKQILNAYYGKEPAQKDTGGDIKTSAGTMNFEEKYLMGIAEMPDSWPKEALKAQAVAARTYAYRYKQSDDQICVSESCQVYLESKANNPPQAWKEAVQETKGMVLEDVSAQYSAIAGGYLNTLGWDTSDGKGGSGNWTTNAWEVKANAPWFYKAWYREVVAPGQPNPNGKYSDKNNSCGRKPWMSQEEMADILNAHLVMKNANGADTGRVLPVTLNSCPLFDKNGNKISGNPYSLSELRSYVNDPVTNISSVTTLSSNQGQTTQVKFQTNRGEISLTGSEFKGIFNQRAPGYLAIHQSGYTFFNIEKK